MLFIPKHKREQHNNRHGSLSSNTSQAYITRMKWPQIKFSYISHKSVISGCLKSGETTAWKKKRTDTKETKTKGERGTDLGHFIIANLVFIIGQKNEKKKHKIRRKVGIIDIRR
jgi:hypothetical protein